MKRSLAILCYMLLSVGLLTAQNDLYQKKMYIHKTDTLRYRIMYPMNYDESKKYPLVIVLHGSGERGNDNEKQLVHGASLFANTENRRNFPAIVIFPQCPSNGFWAPVSWENNKFSYVMKSKPTEPMQLVIRLIKDLVKTKAVDSKRMYVTGLSMGGMGTFDLICRYPNIFAAAAPICGGVNIERLAKIKNMPVRIYHGAADNIVPPAHSEEAYKKLISEGSTKAKLILFQGVGHDSWTNTFAEPDFLTWMFSNKLK